MELLLHFFVASLQLSKYVAGDKNCQCLYLINYPLKTMA